MKSYIVFGANKAGEDIVEEFKKRSQDFLYFLDNDSDKWGSILHGKVIKKPSELLSENINKIFIIVASSAYMEIKTQLEEFGLSENVHFNYWSAQSAQQVFNNIYKNNSWGDSESLSGTGSNLEQTTEIRRILPLLLGKYNINTLTDAPCGDFHWMNTLDLNINKYIGFDIVEDLIKKNKAEYADSKYIFRELNIIEEIVPKADLIFCRDCLVHFSYADIKKTIENFKRSDSKYLLTTTFSELPNNKDIVTGDWRPINLESEPFYFPKPLEVINEKCTENNNRYNDKSLGLWLLDDIQL